MKNKVSKVHQTKKYLKDIIQEAILLEQAQAERLASIHPANLTSARNLLHYKAFRRHDLRFLQKNLRNQGLSGLSRCEGHVMASLLHSFAYLEALDQGALVVPHDLHLSIKEGSKKLNIHSNALLGKRAQGRRVRIMVTLPSEAATDRVLVENLVDTGMNTARINCAHDDATTWKQMIDQVKQASRKLKRKVKISMDLAGPKIRTGEIAAGPSVLRLKPVKDRFGKIITPLEVLLVSNETYLSGKYPLMIPVEEGIIKLFKIGEKLVFHDTRNKKRSIEIHEILEDRVIGYINATAYLNANLPFHLNGKSFQFGEIKSTKGVIKLRQGDTLMVHSKHLEGTGAQFDDDGKLVQPAYISCTNPQIFHNVHQGDRIFFDDGKIGGIVSAASNEILQVTISTGREKPQTLRSDKGINFPDSPLRISGLTSKDREDLKFVTAHADVVNLSFVNCAQDVQDLLELLDQLGVKDKIGIILKIETRRGFLNLMEILLTAMQTFPVGVMIARGDLAIECGWENLGILQEEIMRICEAAHIPDIWATQVLENLVKKGRPSRAEITDASMGQRAECVMLNKGPHILEAIQLLHEILKKMKSYQNKKDVILPILEQSAEGCLPEVTEEKLPALPKQ